MADIRKKFKSVFEDVAHQLEGLDLEPMQDLLHETVNKSKVNDQSKREMNSIIDSKRSPFSLMKYVWDALLAYKDPALKVVSEDETKLSYDLRLKVAEKLDQVVKMLEEAKRPSKIADEEEILLEDMPVFIIIQDMPTFAPFEPTEMPDFNIQDMPQFLD